MLRIEDAPADIPLIQMTLHCKEAVAQDTHMRNKRSTAPPLKARLTYEYIKALRARSNTRNSALEAKVRNEVRMGQMSDETQTTDRKELRE